MTITPEREADCRARLHEYTRTLDCVHCGLCIPYCPTYGVSGRESDSPRGRIYLMRGYAEGSIDISHEAERHLDQCIVCRGCETVCPSGVAYGDSSGSSDGWLPPYCCQNHAMSAASSPNPVSAYDGQLRCASRAG